MRLLKFPIIFLTLPSYIFSNPIHRSRVSSYTLQNRDISDSTHDSTQEVAVITLTIPPKYGQTDTDITIPPMTVCVEFQDVRQIDAHSIVPCTSPTVTPVNAQVSDSPVIASASPTEKSGGGEVPAIGIGPGNPPVSLLDQTSLRVSDAVLPCSTGGSAALGGLLTSTGSSNPGSTLLQPSPSVSTTSGILPSSLENTAANIPASPTPSQNAPPAIPSLKPTISPAGVVAEPSIHTSTVDLPGFAGTTNEPSTVRITETSVATVTVPAAVPTVKSETQPLPLFASSSLSASTPTSVIIPSESTSSHSTSPPLTTPSPGFEGIEVIPVTSSDSDIDEGPITVIPLR